MANEIDRHDSFNRSIASPEPTFDDSRASGTTQNRLIVGLDYGTTFTGVAWQVVEFDKTTAHPKDSTILIVWPRSASKKVPSEISYSESSSQSKQWGFDIAPGSERMVWTKLQLDAQPRIQELRWIQQMLDGMKDMDMDLLRVNGKCPDYPTEDAIDIVADYLSLVREWVHKALIEQYTKAFLDVVAVELVVTVPAVWSPEAYNATFRAVTKSGFTGKRMFKNLKGVLTISEPEAAALYTLKSLLADEPQPYDDDDAIEFIEPGDCFVQCDLGGGTVDCISYRVLEVKPELKLEEIGYAIGDKCGSTFVDSEFLKWLREKLGDDNYRILEGEAAGKDVGPHTTIGPNLRKVMETFEKLKKRYDGKSKDGEYIITLTGELNDLTDLDRDIKEGEINLTDADFRQIFDFALTGTTSLLYDKILHVRNEGHRARYIFLSGGFAESEYVYQQIVEFARSMGGKSGSIEVRRPKDPIEAVARGAVAKRLEQKVDESVYMTSCTTNYGIVLNRRWSDYRHSMRDRYQDMRDGKWKARDQMEWLLRRGDLLLSGKRKEVSTEFHWKFNPKEPTERHIKFVTYDGLDAPDALADLPGAKINVHALRYDLSLIPAGELTPVIGVGGVKLQLAAIRAMLEINEQVRFVVACGTTELASILLDPQNSL